MLGLGIPRSQLARVPCPAFLIRHPGAGPFLVDTGLHPSVAAKPAATSGGWSRGSRSRGSSRARTSPRSCAPRASTRRRSATVVMTHLHFDHASAISEFPNAIFVLTTAEWDAATTDSRPLLRGYRPAHYDYVFDYRTVSFDGDGITSYATFGRTFDLFGDGSVRLAYTPGHSRRPPGA